MDELKQRGRAGGFEAFDTIEVSVESGDLLGEAEEVAVAAELGLDELAGFGVEVSIETIFDVSVTGQSAVEIAELGIESGETVAADVRGELGREELLMLLIEAMLFGPEDGMKQSGEREADELLRAALGTGELDIELGEMLLFFVLTSLKQIDFDAQGITLAAAALQFEPFMIGGDESSAAHSGHNSVPAADGLGYPDVSERWRRAAGWIECDP